MATIAVSPQIHKHTQHNLMSDAQEAFSVMTQFVKKRLNTLIPFASYSLLSLFYSPSKIEKIGGVTLSALAIFGSALVNTDKSSMEKQGAFKIEDLNANAELKSKVIDEFLKLHPSIDFDQSIQQLKIAKEKIEKQFNLKDIDIYINFDKNSKGFALKKAICLPLHKLPLKKDNDDLLVYTLSRELAHIKHKHTLKQSLVDATLATASCAASVFLPNYLWIGLPLIENALKSSVVDKQELEADLTAAKLMGKSKFIKDQNNYPSQSVKNYLDNNSSHHRSLLQRIVTHLSWSSWWYEDAAQPKTTELRVTDKQDTGGSSKKPSRSLGQELIYFFEAIGLGVGLSIAVTLLENYVKKGTPEFMKVMRRSATIFSNIMN